MKKLFPFIGIGLFLALLTSSCENSGNTFASGNVPNEEYELWNIIPQQSIETFALRITEIPLYKYTTSEYNYNIHTYIEKEYLEKTWLSIQFLTFLKFINAFKIYLSIGCSDFIDAFCP